MDYVLDTSFLVGLWRQPERGPEARFLDAHGDCILAMPWIAKGEFLAGAQVAGHDASRVAGFLAGYPLLLPDEATLALYARLFAELRRSGRKVEVNDLWIAASAFEANRPLLTRNLKDFNRIDGLHVIDYATDSLA